MVTVTDMEDNEIQMSIEELEIFFNKFNVIELEAIAAVFEYVHENNLEEIRNVANKVYYEKVNKADEFDEKARKKGFNLLDILEKSDSLSKKELEFLSTLIEDASFFLSSVRDVPYEELIDDFNKSDYNMEQVFKLEDLVIKQLSKRM